MLKRHTSFIELSLQFENYTILMAKIHFLHNKIKSLHFWIVFSLSMLLHRKTDLQVCKWLSEAVIAQPEI